MDAVSLDPEAFARHQLTDEEWEAFDRDVRADLRRGDALELPALPRAAPGCVLAPLRACWPPSPRLNPAAAAPPNPGRRRPA